jgi:hypothetical protein
MGEEPYIYATGEKPQIGDVVRIATPTLGWSMRTELLVQMVNCYGDIVMDDKETGNPIPGVHASWRFALVEGKQ